jgi:hypothetical protein
VLYQQLAHQGQDQKGVQFAKEQGKLSGKAGKEGQQNYRFGL